MGQLCFPLCCPRVPGAHVCRVSVATSFKATVRSDRLRRCEPPPSRMFFLSHCPSVDGLRNCLFCMPSVRGLPPSRRIRRPSVVTGDPGRRQRRCAPPELKVGMRWDGGGSHRQAGPGREQLSSRNRPVAVKVPPNTWQLSTQGSRLDAGPSTYWCHHEMTHGVVLAGRAEKTYSPSARVPSKNLFSGAVRSRHSGSLLVTP